MVNEVYKTFTAAKATRQKLLAILVDPEKFEIEATSEFLRMLPIDTTHIFVGGSTVPHGRTKTVVNAIKLVTAKPVILFPGDSSQITNSADALLFLSLLSGRNPEYLIGQQVKAVSVLRSSSLEVIPTGYILLDGGTISAVARVTNTTPISQHNLCLLYTSPSPRD